MKKKMAAAWRTRAEVRSVRISDRTEPIPSKKSVRTPS
jgi:hypothetical protein